MTKDSAIKATEISWPRDGEMTTLAATQRLGFAYVPRAYDAAVIEDALRTAAVHNGDLASVGAAWN